MDRNAEEHDELLARKKRKRVRLSKKGEIFEAELRKTMGGGKRLENSARLREKERWLNRGKKKFKDAVRKVGEDWAQGGREKARSMEVLVRFKKKDVRRKEKGTG